MKKTFLAGLVTLLPLAMTFFVVAFVVNFLTKPFLGLLSALLGHYITLNLMTEIICQIIILIGIFLAIFSLGFFARKFFFNSLIKVGDNLLKRIPLVNKVYKTSKEIIRSLFSDTEQSFKQVVMIPFPYKEAYCLGLIASKAPKTASRAIEEEMVSVFIPTTPNPTTGYLVMCRRSDLILLEMSSEEAVKYIVSCAVIQPSKVPL